MPPQEVGTEEIGHAWQDPWRSYVYYKSWALEKLRQYPKHSCWLLKEQSDHKRSRKENLFLQQSL
jgi:hypothetical protein